jgi:hypothetical protein
VTCGFDSGLAVSLVMISGQVMAHRRAERCEELRLPAEAGPQSVRSVTLMLSTTSTPAGLATPVLVSSRD